MSDMSVGSVGSGSNWGSVSPPAQADITPQVPGSAGGAAPAASPAPSNPVSLFSRESQREKEYGRFSTNGRTATRGSDDPFHPGSGQLGQLMNRLPGFSQSGNFESEGSVASTSGRVGGPSSLVSGGYDASALRGHVAGSVTGEHKKGAFTAGARGDVTAALGESHFKGQAAGSDVNARAFAGGTLNADGEVKWDPSKGKVAAKLGGEAFLGARVGVETRASNELGAVGGKAEGWAGVGLAGKASAGYQNGRFHAKFELGGALGLGFKVGGSFEVDPGAIANRVTGAMRSLALSLAPGT